MIEIQHIFKQYGAHFALSDINLTLKTGQLVALVGENGAGKSTLMRIMCGYVAPSAGNVLIYGKDIAKARIQALKHIGYVPEISNLYGEMTVYDFFMWISGIWQIKPSEDAILWAADKMQIQDILTQKIETLSKGYKKRVEIAAAILHKPDILILDEPTDGLDPNQKHYIRSFMKEYAKKNIVILSTHVLEDAVAANRIVMLALGKIITDTSISAFRKISPNGDVGEAFRILCAKQAEEKK